MRMNQILETFALDIFKKRPAVGSDANLKPSQYFVELQAKTTSLFFRSWLSSVISKCKD